MLDAEVLLTDEALLQFSEIPGQGDYSKVRRALEALVNVNEAHSDYDPGYEAARPPFPCKVCYAGNYAIYYVIDGTRVVVFSILDNRLDPLCRFADTDDIDLLEGMLRHD